MKRLSKGLRATFLVLLSLALCVGLAACGAGAELKKRSKSIHNYTIEAVYDDATHSLAASYELSYINNTEVTLNELKLHLYPNAYREGALYSPVNLKNEKTVEKAYPSGMSYGDITVANVMLSGKGADFSIGGADKNILTVKLPSALYPSSRVTLTLDFVTRLANILHRLGYGEHAANFGNWYPVACVYEDGGFVTDPYYSSGDCFYSEMANYDVSITAKEGIVLASTGELEAAEKVEKGVRHRVKAVAVRDFAFVLSKDFKVATGKAGATKVMYYYYGDEDPARSLQTGIDSINTFNGLFGDYPYPTMSVVKTGFLHGGMEYPNLVYISDALEADYFQEVIAHETAHQWWYGLVGSNSVRDPWLDEGLTDYCTTVFFEKNPSYGIKKADRIMDAMKSYILYVDIYQAVRGDVDTSMTRPVNGYKDEYEYVYMTYVKGELMFDSLRSAIGDKSFFAALKAYYKENKFTNVTPAHLIGAFEDATGTKLQGFFNSWLDGKVMITDLYGESVTTGKEIIEILPI